MRSLPNPTSLFPGPHSFFRKETEVIKNEHPQAPAVASSLGAHLCLSMFTSTTQQRRVPLVTTGLPVDLSHFLVFPLEPPLPIIFHFSSTLHTSHKSFMPHF